MCNKGFPKRNHNGSITYDKSSFSSRNILPSFHQGFLPRFHFGGTITKIES